jgi:mannose-6-phosphate isomerase-like protein (cupin superfamily)
MAWQFRRIVTTNDANGKSEVLHDGQPTTRLAGILTEMWVTGPGRHNHADRIDHAPDSKGLEPPKGGTVFHFFSLPPMSAFAAMSAEAREEVAQQIFEAMNAGHARRDTSRGPTMHQTASTDYFVLLSGQVTLVLDKEERNLKPFDVVVQRGTNHSWINTGNQDALMMAVLVDDGSATEP